MPSSLSVLEAALDSYETLLRVESSFPDPPDAVSADLQFGLRAAAAVLPVAAFQEYLQTLFLEKFGAMVHQIKADGATDHLPVGMLLRWYRTSLELALDGERRAGPQPEADRIRLVRTAAARVEQRDLDLYAMSRMLDNPDSAGLKAFFKRAGVTSILDGAEATFTQHWGKAESTTFLADKLDEIVKRRHGVAHTADLRRLSREDLADGVRFLRCLGRALETTLTVQTMQITQTALRAALAAKALAGSISATQP